MGINITVDGKRISVGSESKSNILHDIKNFFGSMVFKDFEVKNYEVDNMVDEISLKAIDDIRKDLKKEITDIITPDLIKESIKEYDLKAIAKTIIAKSILKVIKRDTPDLVENALEDFEDDYIIRTKIQDYVRDTISGVFR
jgi:hypothetical protein